MPLGVTVISEVAGSTAHAADINNNNATIIGATTPTFNVVYQTAGVADSGEAGGTFYAASGADVGVVQPFHAVMLHVPTSISTSIQDSHQATLPVTINLISIYKFQLSWTASTTGQTFVHASYSTSGNCILEVNEEEGTFHYHCDGCDQVHPHLSLAEHLITQHLKIFQERGTHALPGNYGLCVVCPHCGGTEHFNTALTGADEQERSSHPYRHRHASKIRQAQRAKGLLLHP